MEPVPGGTGGRAELEKIWGAALAKAEAAPRIPGRLRPETHH